MWQKKRLELLSVRGFKCEICGNEDKQIQVHHRFYIKGREPWEYDNDVFQVLCEDCHAKGHKKDKVKTVTVEVVPEKYREVIDLINKLEEINPRNPDFLNNFLEREVKEALEWSDTQYFGDFVESYLSTFGDTIRFQITQYAYKEQNEIDLWSTINELKSEIKNLKSNIKTP